MSSRSGESEAPAAPQRGSVLRTEIRAARELPRLLLRSPQLAQMPRGDETVTVLPGYGTNDAATTLLRIYLQFLGHQAKGWGLGVNRGDVARVMPAVVATVERRAERADGPTTLIGWSLGGVLAREVARSRPDLVKRVITYGTPVIGGPRFTRTADAYGPEMLDEIDRRIAERNRIAILAPITAIYSKRDGVVDWRACIDRTTPNVEHMEVSSSHVGMGADPDVWERIARRLGPTRRT